MGLFYVHANVYICTHNLHSIRVFCHQATRLMQIIIHRKQKMLHQGYDWQRIQRGLTSCIYLVDTRLMAYFPVQPG